MRQPPPGQMITPTPFGFLGRNTVRVGSETLRSIVAPTETPARPLNSASAATPSSTVGGPSGHNRITSVGRSVMRNLRALHYPMISALRVVPTRRRRRKPGQPAVLDGIRH